ncbi:MAG: TIGR02757 family protein [Spirochaetaceae bacterium]|nr:TIGR02757 family protein [Spirochaetaceae bacterium]
MEQSLIEKLKIIADKYEKPEFISGDPSFFLWKYDDEPNAETAAFIAAMLSFGSRKQFLPKIETILNLADNSGGINEWLKSGAFKSGFIPCGKETCDKFYRFYSYKDLTCLFCALQDILCTYGSLGECVKARYQQNPEKHIIDILSEIFDGCAIVPKGRTSAKKRLCMFARWMVRTNSCVDRGFWQWYPKEKLIIPLDVHVLDESIKLGLIPPDAKATRKTAELLTGELRQVWQDDPVKGDFALFGLGVSS